MTQEKLIDLNEKQLALLKAVIKQHIPDKTVWVYGSRVTWKANTTSDIDLAVFDCTDSQIYELKEALEKSDLLNSVDVMSWEQVPDSFRTNIKRKYVVLEIDNGELKIDNDKLIPLEGWREVRLGDVVKSNCKNIGKGYEYSQILYLDTGSITTGKIQSLQDYQVSQAPSRAKRLVKNGDIVYSNVRPIQRHYGFIKNPPGNLVVSTGFSVIETNQSKAEPLFIYHLLTSNNIVEKLDAIAEGATSAYPALRPSDIEDLEISLPPLPEQKTIAEVLSSLDDKIDLLHRQNKTLEDIAQTLFRQWFIEQAHDDWEEKPLDEIAHYLNGLACQKYPPENELDKLPVLKIKELGSGFTEHSDWATSDVNKKYIVEFGDVIFSWSGSLMLKIWNGQRCVLNQHLFKVTSEQYPKWFYYFWTKHHLDKFIAIANSKATTMGHIKRGDLSSSLVLVPSYKELSKMNNQITPTFEKIISNQSQINTLENLRDTLLPKLMSGEVKINTEENNV